MIRVWAILAMVLGLAGCNVFGPSSYRYKMTITVKTPEGEKTFSSVRAVSFSNRMEGGYNAHVKGEAVVMDLPGGPAFALLSGADGDVDYAAHIGGQAMRGTLKPGGANRDYARGQFAEIYPTAPQIESYMPKNPLPMMVRFRDIRDPKSVERVDAAQIGVTRVTVEMTLDRATTGIEKRLVWLPNYYDKMLDGSANNNSQNLDNNLSQTNFQTGVSK